MKTIQTNKKPISSKPMKVDIKRLTSMGLLPDKMSQATIDAMENEIIRKGKINYKDYIIKLKRTPFMGLGSMISYDLIAPNKTTTNFLTVKEALEIINKA